MVGGACHKAPSERVVVSLSSKRSRLFQECRQSVADDQPRTRRRSPTPAHTGERITRTHVHTPHTRTRIAQSRPCTLWQTHPHGRVHVQAPSCAQKCPRSHLSGESHEVKKCPRSHGGKQTRRVHALHVRLRCNCSDMQKRLPNWGALAFIRCNCSDTQKPERCRPNL